MATQTEVARHTRRQPSDRIRELRHSTDALARLEHDDPQSGATQIRRANESVVARADDDRVVRQAAASELSPLRLRQARSTATAALRPGAPEMAPPGCADEPHSHRSRSGVAYPAPSIGRPLNSCSSSSSPWKMFPSVRPKRASMSGGASTWRWRIFSGRSGAYLAIAATTASPNASRWSSHDPFASSYGAYWTKHAMTCFPGGATEGSMKDGKPVST